MSIGPRSAPRPSPTLPEESFEGSWPYTPCFFEHDGVRLRYADEGAGEPVVMLHGNPTSGYVYRRFIPPLSNIGRCVVPDHVGFGKFDTPLDAPHTLTRYIENLTALLLDLDLRDVTLVVQNWGGSIRLGFAVEHLDGIKRLVILNTRVFLYPEGTRLHDLLELFRQPHVGEAMVLSLNLFVEGYLFGRIHYGERLSEVMSAYHAPFPDYASRIGMLAFPRDIPVGEHHPSAPLMKHIQEKLGELEVPTAVIWGMRDPDFETSVADEWTEVYQHAEVHHLENASHFLQEDKSERMVSLIEDFLRRNP